MKRLLTGIPAVLVFMRFMLGPLLWWSVDQSSPPIWFLAGFVFAFFSDIFDGIIARRTGVATSALRLADSWVDTWFYLWVMGCIWIKHAEAVRAFAIPLTILAVLQISEWIYGRVKFGRWTGYHAYLAKLWGISLFFAIISVMLINYAGVFWWIAIIIGSVNSIENWCLTLTLDTWTTDVKSIFHVWKIINGRAN